MNRPPATLVPLPFESQWLGRAFRLDPAPGILTVSALQTALSAQSPDFVSCRIAAGDDHTAAILVACGFRLIETMVTLAAPLPATPTALPPGIAIARPDEAEALAAIGGTAFIHDRFHADSRVPHGVGDAIKNAWVTNGLAGRAEVALAAHDQDGQAVGFMLCRRAAGVPCIDLVAVARQAQGQGHGIRLVTGAMAAYGGRAPVMHVSTQETNTVSLATYTRCGFAEIRWERTFHWMAPACAVSAAR